MNRDVERLQHHREILRGKLAIPSNGATRASLSAHLARVEAQIDERLNPRPPEDFIDRSIRRAGQTRSLKQYRSRNRRWIRHARLFGDDDRAGFLTIRIDGINDRLQQIREQDECDFDGTEPLKKPSGTVEALREQMQRIIQKYRGVA